MSGNIKNALLLVALIAVIAISGMLIIKPNIEAKQSLDGEIVTLQGRLSELQAKEADRAVYEAGITKNQAAFDEILAKFPEGIEQENYIKFLGDTDNDKDLNIDFNSYGFSEAESFYVLGQGAVGTDGTAAATPTDATATTEAPAADATATTEATATDATTTSSMDEDMTGIKTQMSINYEGTYAGVKDFLLYVMGNKDRMTIDTMNLTYQEEDQVLKGDMSFNIYAITSPSRRLAQPEIDGVDIGTDNIFDTKGEKGAVNKDLAKNVDDGSKIIDDYDYYVALNPATSNADSIAIAAKSDNSTKISSNVNEVENATIKFFKVGNDQYYVSYNIGDVTYPENFDQGAQFEPGDDLNLLIQSSKRKNDKDKAGVKLVIDNETDMKLNVKINGDDSENPRVKIASRIGQVQVYE